MDMLKMTRSSRRSQQFFESHIKEIDLENAGFFDPSGIINPICCIAYWFKTLLSAYKFANKWVELFFISPDMIELTSSVFYSRSSTFI